MRAHLERITLLKRGGRSAVAGRALHARALAARVARLARHMPFCNHQQPISISINALQRLARNKCLPKLIRIPTQESIIQHNSSTKVGCHDYDTWSTQSPPSDRIQT